MKYCPIMTIGFAPPAQGEKDARKCKKDCAWYNLDQEDCAVNLILETIQRTETTASDIVDLLYEGTLPEYEDDV